MFEIRRQKDEGSQLSVVNFSNLRFHTSDFLSLVSYLPYLFCILFLASQFNHQIEKFSTVAKETQSK